MKISFIVPIRNEEELLERVLTRVRALPIEKELVLVDDGSTDSTPQILAREAQHSDTVILRHKINQGKGMAIRTGLEHATGDIVIVQDADLEYNPEEVPAVVKPIAEGRANAAYGSRFMGRITKMRLPNYIANRFLSLFVSLLYGQKMTDLETCYKAFRRELVQSIPLTCRRFEFDPEVTSKVLKKGERIIEVPISYNARTFEEGKKIGWRDFFKAIWMLVKVRLFWRPN